MTGARATLACRHRSPPWGGPEYTSFGLGDIANDESLPTGAGAAAQTHVACAKHDEADAPQSSNPSEGFNLAEHIEIGGVDGVALWRLAQAAAPNVVYFVPRTVRAQHVDAVLGIDGSDQLEIEAHILNHKLKTQAIYAGPRFAAARR